MIIYFLTVLVSFFLTLLISLPYIKLLYKLNIRRIAKTDLDAALPGRALKMGTPIMGGTVILLAIIVLSTLFLSDWAYYPMVMVLCVFGGIVGAVDEYTNTLGRTFRALRISKSKSVAKPASLFPVRGWLLTVKKMVLYPWKLFEEALRMMGSQQRGLKSHHKLLLHLLIAGISVYFLLAGGHQPVISFPYFGVLPLGYVFIPFVVVFLLGFANAFGITDGMDGLSAGSHAIAFALVGIVAAYFGEFEVALLAFIVVGAELAFLYFNFFPARMEMSDVGTLPLGMLFGLLGILLYREVPLLIIGSLFIIEIGSTVLQVWSVKLRQKRIFLVAPIHHHFEKMGWPETKVVMRFWLFTLISGLCGVVLAIARIY